MSEIVTRGQACSAAKITDTGFEFRFKEYKRGFKEFT
ncbi:MAG: DUF1731 domain-containing protein [Chitinophagales bacterium]|nr:DUF1731 domain-containing protein [Chitinophagales bacterium]